MEGGSPDHDESRYNSLTNLYIEKKIGKGQFSEVYRAKCRMDNETVALKKIQIFQIMDHKARSDCIKEIELLKVSLHKDFAELLIAYIPVGFPVKEHGFQMAVVTSLGVIASLLNLKSYIFGPRVFRIFPFGGGSSGREYDANNLEYVSDAFIKTFSYALSLSTYSSPLVAYYVYKRGVMTAENLLYTSRLLGTLATSVTVAFLLRGISRYNNTDYERFIKILKEARSKPEQRALLQTYDFEFYAWPVDFRSDESNIKSRDADLPRQRAASEPLMRKILQLPRRLLEYVIAHGFARPMVFPGSVKLLQNAMAGPLDAGRTSLIEKKGRRAKLLSKDGIELDTMFLDRRNLESNGDTLVISSEGNAGFYELGCMITPRNAGYSVLGWNHPGFAGSSGVPGPESEQNAIDAVVKYAVEKLGFQMKDIILFAWSIGGYATSCAAVAHPDVKAVILDATFDDVAPLAEAKMPDAISGIVKGIIRDYFPLNVVENLIRLRNGLKRYPGPIRLVRRFQEEIITTQQYVPATNRGNFLLLRLLQFRYPNVMTKESSQAVMNFLSAEDASAQAGVLASFGYMEDLCEVTVRNSTAGQWPLFPCTIGQQWDSETRIQVALFLATRYMVDFDATHCTPLPTSFFQMPWEHK